MVPQRRATAVLVALLLLVATASAHAQTTPPAPSFDTVRGTIKGSTRFIGLGGAFVAIADDTEGVPFNAASVAVRLPYSWDAWSFAFGIDFSIATWLPKNDFYKAETGDARGGSLFGSLGAVLNYRHAGFGVSAEAQQNAVTHQTQGISTKLGANFGLVHLAAAYGYFDGQLLLGTGLRLVGFSFDGKQSSAPLTAGVGYAAGFIVKPKGQQYRVGAAIEQPINAKFVGEPGSAPIATDVPWTASVGFAYQFGTRKLNPPFVTALARARKNAAGCEPTPADVKRAEAELFDEYQRDQTRYLLVSTQLALIEGGGDLALGPVALDRPLFSPRLGLEGEAIPRWLRLRTGTYLELPTSDVGQTRLHGTGGVDIKLFRWNVFGLVGRFDYWQLSLAADGAKRYLNSSFSIGFWH